MKLFTTLLLSFLCIATSQPPREVLSRKSGSRILNPPFSQHKPGGPKFKLLLPLVYFPLSKKTPPPQKSPFPRKSLYPDPVGELFEADPDIQANPASLLNPDQPYPNITHQLPQESSLSKAFDIGYTDPDKDPAAAAPTPAGTFLGQVGKETTHFVRKCKRCCRVTKTVFEKAMGIRSPTRGCTRCTTSYIEPRPGKCPEGRYLGHFYTPTDCFFERCHRMLLKGSGCLCLWDRWNQVDRGNFALA